VWQRHGLLTKHDRLLRLEKATAERQISLTDEQVRLLERFSPEFRERHIEAPHTGALVAVDTFFVGVLKGVGKVYLQTAIDCASRYAWARLYPNKLPVTAVQLLNNDVLPTFEQQGAKVEAVLSDNGREFCGREDQHPYELFLQSRRHRAQAHPRQPAPVQRHRRAAAPHSARRTLPRRRPQDLVRDHRGDADHARCLHGRLQHQTSAPGTRHEWQDASQGVPRRHSKEQQKGGQDRAEDRRLILQPDAAGNCQAISIAVQQGDKASRCLSRATAIATHLGSLFVVVQMLQAAGDSVSEL
jgi:hypothetical protein